MAERKKIFIPQQSLYIFIVSVLAIVIILNLIHPPKIILTTNVSECSKTLSAQVTKADIIMSGSVFMIVPGGQDGAQVIIEPKNIYKGEITTPTIKINALDDSGMPSMMQNQLHELHFQTGQSPYLLFLHRQPDGTFNTRACDGTRMMTNGLTNEEKSILKV